jgi:ABC-type lipoprotein release transport system permease subunit
MALPLSYNLRSLKARWQLTLFSVVGIALAVLVLVALMAMAAGFRIALRSTGRADNAIVIQKGMASELMSDISIGNAAVIMVDPRIARGADGRALASPEIQALISLPRTDERAQVNVAVRGVTPRAFEVRGGLRVVEGRSFRPGASEVIVGRRVRARFALGPGSRLMILRVPWEVVGVFAAEGSGFESEIWGDLQTLAGPLRRAGGYQTLVLRLEDSGSLAALTSALETDRRMQVQVRQERKFYEEQAGPVVLALTGLAIFVAVIMGLGAALAGMNTMFAIVAARAREVGTLRALGFSRPAILSCFVLESVTLAIVGGVLGCALALPANGLTSATYGANWAELAFAFRTTPAVLGSGLAFAALLGLFGGLLPALRAARLPIASALREG